LTFLPSDPLISLTLSKDDPPSQCPKVAIWEAGRAQEKQRDALDLLQGSLTHAGIATCNAISQESNAHMTLRPPSQKLPAGPRLWFGSNVPPVTGAFKNTLL
jgi:Tfp pilus assembly protein PilW